MVALTIGAVFLVPVVDIIDSTSGEVVIENETVTNDADFNSTYDLQGYDIVSGSDTVERFNSTSGNYETLSGGGTDYTLNESAGDISFTDGGAVSAGDEVRASYNYQATDSVVTSIVGMLPVFLALLLLVPLAGKVSEGV